MSAIVRVPLAAAFLVMGSLHFRRGPARTMAAMVPPALVRGPVTAERLVRFTGVCEIAGGVGLLVPQTRRAASAALVVFLAAVFPANVRAGRNPERFGPLAIPFVPRLLAQLGLGAAVVVAGRPTIPR